MPWFENCFRQQEQGIYPPTSIGYNHRAVLQQLPCGKRQRSSPRIKRRLQGASSEPINSRSSQARLCSEFVMHAQLTIADIPRREQAELISSPELPRAPSVDEGTGFCSLGWLQEHGLAHLQLELERPGYGCLSGLLDLDWRLNYHF